ncbi:cytochrome c family protein [uncultured Sulfitobacter sp.]|uniref:c-type cytochrome n=1 Tax=uncultured Sulfitobacter sp. TaxID=191468 RepID=UPI002617D28F|nr:cytochrome c family protein [uncultured Sulfitobacter sp.]
MFIRKWFYAALIFGLGTSLASADGDSKKGERVFKKCKACHQIGEGAKSRTGPILTGIIDAPAGIDPDFGYSDALKAAAEDGLVWNQEALTAFLTKPRDFLPKTKMSFSGLRKEKDIDDLLAYLQTFESDVKDD